jgi:hypothetical protein
VDGTSKLWVDDLRDPPDVRVHSANPVGRRWLLGMIERCGAV